MAHEVSHASARDPLRLLFMGSCPDFLGLFRLDERWRLAFASACEFAADEGASRGNREAALDLASALIKVARLRASRPSTAGAMIDVAVSSAFPSGLDLEGRVRALVNLRGEQTGDAFVLRSWVLVAAIVVICGAGLMGSAQVQAATEGVGRLLAP